jgi:peroxiredoxin
MNKYRTPYLKPVSIILFQFSVCVANLSAQNLKFKIHGLLTGIRADTAQLLLYPDSGSYKVFQKKVQIIDGNFVFEGELQYPFISSIFYYYKGEYLRKTAFFYVDTGKYDVLIKHDSINASNSFFVESAANKEYQSLFAPVFDSIEHEYDKFAAGRVAINKYFNGKIPTATLDSLNAVKNEFLEKRGILMTQFIKQNPNSTLLAWYLIHLCYRSRYHPNFQDAYTYFNSKVKYSPTGKQLKELLDSQLATAIGKKFPSVRMTSIKDAQVNLSDAPKSRFILLDFWFAACAPCKKQFPELQKIYKKHKLKGFEVIGVSIDKKENKPAMYKVIKELKLTWVQWMINENQANEELSIVSYPSNFLIDETGKIIARNIDVHQLDKLLSKSLK